jgi:general secretion pathway protein D
MRSHRTSTSAIGLAIVLVLVAGLGTPPVAVAERTFTLNFKRTPIAAVIERVSKETRRTIIFDEQVRGNVSIVTKRPVTESEAWSILDASLSMLGFSLLPSTVENWRISKVAEAVGEAPFVTELGDEEMPFVTTLIPLKATDLSAAMKVLEPLSGSRVTLVPFEPTHSVIASGPEREIGRLITIADELNRVDEYELRSRVLRYRDVGDVEPLIEARIESGGISERVLQIWSDERTNSVLYRGTDDETASFVKFLDRVDQPIVGSGQIRILRVLNRDPEEMGELIRSLGQSAGPGGKPGVARGTELAGAEFSLVVDKASRSLVVRADEATHIAIRKVLETLDEQPQLIGVDITVSELRSPRRYNLGFGFSLPFSSGDDFSAILVSAPPGGLRAIPDDQTTVFGRVAHDNGVPFTIDGGGGVEIPILQTGVIRGGQFSVKSEVLMKPSLIVTAGERHEIFVGNNFPVPVSDSSGSDGSDGLTTSDLQRTVNIERTDIGIKMVIEAKAGRQGKIQLDIDLDLSSLTESAAGPVEDVGPTFVHQTLNTIARVEDGETAIVAVSRQVIEGRGRSGVPWLSDIPFLGWFFSTDGENDQDVRLVISARARRISSPAELVADTIRRRLALQRRNARGEAFPSSEGPPYGVRVTTRAREDDAEAIHDSLSLKGHRSIVHKWSFDGNDYFDVYIISLPSMAAAAEIANVLANDGWEADLVVLPTRS